MNNPTFEYEQQYWQQGIHHVAGIDEAGMGALAGPVVAAAVILPPLLLKERGLGGEVMGEVKDSKKLSAKKRQSLVPLIKKQAFTWAIGEASVQEIDQMNIRNAAHLAMRRAIEQLKIRPDILLVDGNPAEIHPSIPTQNIIKGDNISLSIAVASILAKVHRDQIMTQLHEQYPGFNFSGHKGYGSAEHLATLKKFGPSPIHRRSYSPVRELISP